MNWDRKPELEAAARKLAAGSTAAGLRHAANTCRALAHTGRVSVGGMILEKHEARYVSRLLRAAANGKERG